MYSPFTDCNQTQFCCQFWLYLLDMSPFLLILIILRPKMVFKMSWGMSYHLLGYPLPLFKINFLFPTPVSTLAQHGLQNEGHAEMPDPPVPVSPSCLCHRKSVIKRCCTPFSSVTQKLSWWFNGFLSCFNGFFVWSRSWYKWLCWCWVRTPTPLKKQNDCMLCCS